MSRLRTVVVVGVGGGGRVGVGGGGREFLDVIEAVASAHTGFPLVVSGVIDDSPRAQDLVAVSRRGVPYVGTTTEWLTRGETADYVIGVADPQARAKIDVAFRTAGLAAATLMHPDATVGSSCELGAGSVVYAGARLTPNIRLGRHVHVHVNATIEHDSVLGSFVSVYPQGAVSGTCLIGERATIGAGAVVFQGMELGREAFVGAGSVVTRHVQPGSIVKGVPAR